MFWFGNTIGYHPGPVAPPCGDGTPLKDKEVSTSEVKASFDSVSS